MSESNTRNGYVDEIVKNTVIWFVMILLLCLCIAVLFNLPEKSIRNTSLRGYYEVGDDVYYCDGFLDKDGNVIWYKYNYESNDWEDSSLTGIYNIVDYSETKQDFEEYSNWSIKKNGYYKE